MRYKGIPFSLLLMAAAAAASAQGKSSLTQLNQLDAPPAVAPVSAASIPPGPAAQNKVPIKNFGTAIWKDSDRGRKEGVLFRGGELDDEASFKYLGELGIKTVISLRAMHEPNKDLCAAYKMDCLEYGIVPVPRMGLARSGSFMKAFRRVTEEMKAGNKVFIYCQGGRHRTSAVVAAVTVREAACGKPFDKAELSDSLAKMLKEHGFYNSNGRAFFMPWEKEMQGWVERFEDNQWLCK